MKQNNDRVIKKGDYYQLQMLQDLILQQKLPKKQEISSTAVSSINENIITVLPDRKQAIKQYSFVTRGDLQVEAADFGLGEHRDKLEELLKIDVRDQERLEIETLLREITQIQTSQQLPLPTLPIPTPPPPSTPPTQIPLTSTYNLGPLLTPLEVLQSLKPIQLSKLQGIVELLLNQDTTQTPAQPLTSHLDSRTKEEIEGLYHCLNQLRCVDCIGGILAKIGASQGKFVELMKQVEGAETVFQRNRVVKQEIQNDAMVLNMLEEGFKKNLEKVKEIVKKLGQL